MRKYFLSALALASATLCLNDGRAALELGANSLLVAFYLIFASIQAGAAIGLAFSTSRLALSTFISVFVFVAAFDLFMLQPIQSAVDYLGVLALILSVVYWIALRRIERRESGVAS